MRTTHNKPCPECEGRGTMLFERVHAHNCSRDVGYIEEYEADCDNCFGSGEIEDEDYEEDEDERGDWLYHKREDKEEEA